MGVPDSAQPKADRYARMTRGRVIRMVLDNMPPGIEAIEVGRLRSATEFCGHSTLHIACHANVRRLTSIDIEPKTEGVCRTVIPPSGLGKIAFVNEDVIDWLSGAVAAGKQSFDFIYLDSANDADHCRALLVMCRGVSRTGTIIILDDTDNPKVAHKGAMTLPYIAAHPEVFEVVARIPRDATCHGMTVVRVLKGADDGRAIWPEAQRHERRFWDGFLTKCGLAAVNVKRDIGHMQAMLDVIGGWLPQGIKRGVELGCGPCGLLPHLDVAERYGLDPLVEWFTGKGVDYAAIGYRGVVTGKMSDAPALLSAAGIDVAGIGLVVCCNVLDHVDDLDASLKGLCALGKQGTQALLIYDVRTIGSALHPTVTEKNLVHDGMVRYGWRLIRTAEQPPTHDRNRITGRRYGLWIKE